MWEGTDRTRLLSFVNERFGSLTLPLSCYQCMQVEGCYFCVWDTDVNRVGHTEVLPKPLSNENAQIYCFSNWIYLG